MASSQLFGQSALMTNTKTTANEDTMSGSKMQENISPEVNVQASPETALDSFNDSGFVDWEDERSDPHRYPYDYEDFVLFERDAPLLSTDSFFADLDASTKPAHRERSNNGEGAAVLGLGEGLRTVFYDPVHDAVQISISQSVYDSINNFNVRCQPGYFPPSKKDIPIYTPLEKWTNTYERHESISYRLSQPPSPTPRLHSRQPSRQSV